MTDDPQHPRTLISSLGHFASAMIGEGRVLLLSVAKRWLSPLTTALEGQLAGFGRLSLVARPVALVRCPKTQATYSRLRAPEGHPWRNR